jgi:hypothetical protein
MVNLLITTRISTIMLLPGELTPHWVYLSRFAVSIRIDSWRWGTLEQIAEHVDADKG